MRWSTGRQDTGINYFTSPFLPRYAFANVTKSQTNPPGIQQNCAYSMMALIYRRLAQNGETSFSQVTCAAVWDHHNPSAHLKSFAHRRNKMINCISLRGNPFNGLWKRQSRDLQDWVIFSANRMFWRIYSRLRRFFNLIGEFFLICVTVQLVKSSLFLANCPVAGLGPTLVRVLQSLLFAIVYIQRRSIQVYFASLSAKYLLDLNVHRWKCLFPRQCVFCQNHKITARTVHFKRLQVSMTQETYAQWVDWCCRLQPHAAWPHPPPKGPLSTTAQFFHHPNFRPTTSKDLRSCAVTNSILLSKHQKQFFDVLCCVWFFQCFSKKIFTGKLPRPRPWPFLQGAAIARHLRPYIGVAGPLVNHFKSTALPSLKQLSPTRTVTVSNP